MSYDTINTVAINGSAGAANFTGTASAMVTSFGALTVALTLGVSGSTAPPLAGEMSLGVAPVAVYPSSIESVRAGTMLVITEAVTTVTHQVGSVRAVQSGEMAVVASATARPAGIAPVSAGTMLATAAARPASVVAASTAPLAVGSAGVPASIAPVAAGGYVVSAAVAMNGAVSAAAGKPRASAGGRVAEPWSITAVISGDMATSQSLTPVPLRAARAGQMLIDRGNVC